MLTCDRIYKSVASINPQSSLKSMIEDITKYNVELCILFKSLKFPFNKCQICTYAAENSNFKVLQWTKENNYPLDEYTCPAAARSGNLEILQWARHNPCPWNGWICANAARGSYLEVLKWLRENGCSWDNRTCTTASERGNL